MRRARIAIAGDTQSVHGSLTNAGAIAIELANGWPVDDVGIRTVANSADSWEILDQQFGDAGVTTWLSIREPRQSRGNRLPRRWSWATPSTSTSCSRHDLVIVACRNVALRRFLADLPVHTYPGVRQLALLHFDEGAVEGERIEDLTRFDVIVGSDTDYVALGRVLPRTDQRASPRPRWRARLLGPIPGPRSAGGDQRANSPACVRTRISYRGPALHAPYQRDSDSPWAGFVGAIAMGMVNRLGWDEIGRDAARQLASRTQASRTGSPARKS